MATAVNVTRTAPSGARLRAGLASALPAWPSSVSVNTWGTIPASNTIADINPDNDAAINPNYPGTAPWRSTGSWAAEVTAWNGAIHDGSGTMWWIDAGGHNDQHANGAFRYLLNQATPVVEWVRLPSGAVGMDAIGSTEWTDTPQTAEFSDGRPKARHTVNMGFYWPGRGPGNVTEILLSPSGGYETNRLRPYICSPITGERTYLGANKYNEPGGGWCSACYDPVRDVVWKMPTSSNTSFSKWGGPDSDTWTDVGSATYFSGSVSMTYIPGHDLILVGNGDSVGGQTVVGGWAVFDPADGTLYTPTFTGAPGSAPNAFATGLWPGAVQPAWSAYLGCALAWDMSTGNTTQVMTITPPSGDPRTDAWTIGYLTVDGSNAVTPSARVSAGTFGRFFVWDAARICGVINAANEAGYFFRYG